MNWQENRKKEIEKLFENIEQKFSITREDILSKSRKKNLVMARRIIMNILFEVFEKDNMTQVDISAAVKRDRTSFVHNRKEHFNEYKRYKGYKQDYDSVKTEFTLSLS